MGSVVSIVVAPPTDIGANLPKYRTRKGAASSAIISLIILERRATVPSSRCIAIQKAGNHGKVNEDRKSVV